MFGKFKCYRVRALLWDYTDSRLPPTDTQQVQQHLLRCPACRVWAESETRTVEYVAAYRAQSVAPAPPAWLELREALAAPSSPHDIYPVFSFLRFPRWAALLCGSAALAGGLWMTAQYSSQQSAQSSSPHISQHSTASPGQRNVVQQNTIRKHSRPLYDTQQYNTQKKGMQQPLLASRLRAPKYTNASSSASTTSLPSYSLVPHAARVDDLRYLNTDPIDALAAWTTLPPNQTARLRAEVNRAAQNKDDFVQTAPPLFASQGMGGVRAATETYQHDQEVIDARLVYKVTVAFKAAPFREVCRTLRERTGIDLKADPSVADESVTLFCEGQTLRDIMRQITHVFGFVWARKEKEGAFTYELLQDVRAQIAEEEMRNRDRNATLISLADSMEQYRPYLDRTPEQLQAAAGQAKGKEAELLSKLMGQEWGAIQSYFSLTAEQRAALFNYQEIAFSANPVLPGLSLPPDTNRLLLARSGLYIQANPDGKLLMGGALITHDEDGKPINLAPGTPAGDWKEAYAGVNLKLNSPEAGRLELSGGVGLFVAATASHEEGYYKEQMKTLAEGVRPSSALPNNARWNRSLRPLPEFQRSVSLKPRHTCPTPAHGGLTIADHIASPHSGPQKDTQESQVSTLHLTPADVWEEVHRQTGLPIIADAYTHLYSPGKLTQRAVSLFDALCRDSDAMNMRWKKEGDFLQCRSLTFFWDKRKEVPVRLLTHWQKDGLQPEGMPLQDVLEMAQMSDDQLDAEAVAEGVSECWKLPEWKLVGPGTTRRGIQIYSESRDHARLLAKVPIRQLEEAARPEGLQMSMLPVRLREEWETYLLQQFHWEPAMLTDIRFHVDYVPRDRYLWFPRINDTVGNRKRMEKLPVVSDTTREGALAAAQRVDSNAEMADIRRTSAVLAITYHWQAFGVEGYVPFGTPSITLLPTDQPN